MNILFHGCYPIFKEYLYGKPSVYILKMCREERLRGGRHVKNLEIFSMNNKIIIEFGYLTM